jgi:hypothetical protein
LLRDSEILAMVQELIGRRHSILGRNGQMDGHGA